MLDKKNNAFLSSLQANDNPHDAERDFPGHADPSILANGPDQHRPTERESRLHLVLQEIGNEYETNQETGYASFPEEQISGMQWVLDVLDDLTAFAKSRGARNIVNTLVRTSFEVEKELAAHQVP